MCIHLSFPITLTTITSWPVIGELACQPKKHFFPHLWVRTLQQEKGSLENHKRPSRSRASVQKKKRAMRQPKGLKRLYKEQVEDNETTAYYVVVRVSQTRKHQTNTLTPKNDRINSRLLLLAREFHAMLPQKQCVRRSSFFEREGNRLKLLAQ